MDSFAFIIHPIDPKRDVSRKFPFLGRVLSERQIDFFSTFFPPVYISEIEGITSEDSGKVIKGWFIACPYTPRRMMELRESTVYRKIIQSGRMAEKLGADILRCRRPQSRARPSTLRGSVPCTRSLSTSIVALNSAYRT